MRLRAAGLPGLLCLFLALGGCGEGPGRAAATDGAGGDEVSDGERSCAPAVVEHRFGSTTVDFHPDRIVPVSIRDQETLIALELIPDALVEGPYRLPYVEWPWVPDRVGTAGLEVMSNATINYEQVGRLRPDLVLGVASGLTDEDHRILNRLAPTVAQTGDFVDYGVPWQELTRTVGEIVCRRVSADTLVSELVARFDEVRRNHPGFAGRQVVVAMAGGPEGSYWVYGPQDSRIRFLASLGFELPSAVAELAGERFVATLSRERADLLDADLLIWLASDAERAALQEDPLYIDLDVVRDDRVIYLDPEGPEVAALTNLSALNLPWVLDSFVPRLASLIGEEATDDR